MSERITRKDVDARLESLNRRMADRGSIYRYAVEGRNGYVAIDRVSPAGNVTYSTVRCGTKRETAEFLHAMMVALDDAAVTS
jgi:hypothetical protein